jgi:hypothetical protein
MPDLCVDRRRDFRFDSFPSCIMGDTIKVSMAVSRIRQYYQADLFVSDALIAS